GRPGVTPQSAVVRTDRPGGSTRGSFCAGPPVRVRKPGRPLTPTTRGTAGQTPRVIADEGPPAPRREGRECPGGTGAARGIDGRSRRRRRAHHHVGRARAGVSSGPRTVRRTRLAGASHARRDPRRRGSSPG